MARISAAVVKEHGALSVLECWLDETGPDASSYHRTDARQPDSAYASFFCAAGARDDETVVLSTIEWPDKAARDIGMEKVTRDPRMQFDDRPAAFDGGRLIAGGFRPVPLEPTIGWIIPRTEHEPKLNAQAAFRDLSD